VDVKLKVTQLRSAIGRQAYQKKTLKALGIRRLHQTVRLEDSPQVRGMIEKVKHLVRVEEEQPNADS
jgi:large subunit ribosomal protein L30